MSLFKNKGKNIQDRQPSFIMAIEDAFSLIGTEDCVVVGKINGEVHVGDAIYISNPGSDDDGMFLSVIEGIETSPGVLVKYASNCNVGLKINSGKKFNIRKSSVMFTKEKSSREVHEAYINVLGDEYISKKQLNISDDEFEKLTLTDCVEIWGLFLWYCSKMSDDKNEKTVKENHEKINKLIKKICDKLFECNEIYCIFNKKTGEPHMFSKTVINENDNYMCSPPSIRIFTKAYEEVAKYIFSENQFEIRKIDNGKNKDGIYNFLASVFYLNGACGIQVINEETRIDAGILVEKPDYTNVEKQNIPVTNPDLMRWMLLIGQLGRQESEDGKKYMQSIMDFYLKRCQRLIFLFQYKWILKMNLLIKRKN